VAAVTVNANTIAVTINAAAGGNRLSKFSPQREPGAITSFRNFQDILT
jgi:hypothetical protein